MDQPDTSPLNLAGVWHGLYSYPVAVATVPFVATLSFLMIRGALDLIR